ncbi:MAG: hypothetical protein CML21_00510 [Rheinheimera sp.]|nr:hypothetical protein [Rheinheimera sp.]|tara:strand:- start:925 stop:1155 length:231 start_codon:yes stop_codon:yes gene_type:complete
MQVTITKTYSEDIILSQEQVQQIAIQAILKKIGLDDSAQIRSGIIYSDVDRVENVRVRVANDDDYAAFATISLLKK